MTQATEALRIWNAGLAAVGGYAATDAALDGAAPDQILAVGKAAGAMARAALDRYGPVPCLVVTKDGHAEGLPPHARLIEAAHPVPDTRSLVGGAALRAAVADMTSGSRLLLLVSGGASSLAEDLHEGYDLDDLAALNRGLLSQGLDIGAMNAKRRDISHIKGGGLLSGFGGAAVEVLAVSDVPRDEIGVIGSGIGAAPPSYGFDYTCRIVASNEIARAAAAAAAPQGSVLENAEALYDDVPALGRRIGQALREMSSGVMILGGEPTVQLPEHPGEGGRNQALALEIAREIAGLQDICVIVGGTDGTDGPTDAAGGQVDGTTWAEGAQDALDRADSGTFLRARNARLVTGPTGTNVMDLLVAVKG